MLTRATSVQHLSGLGKNGEKKKIIPTMSTRSHLLLFRGEGQQRTAGEGGKKSDRGQGETGTKGRGRRK